MFRVVILLAALIFLWWSISYVLLPIILGKGLFKKNRVDEIKKELKDSEHRKKLAQLELDAVKAEAEAIEKEKLTEQEAEEIYNNLENNDK